MFAKLGPVASRLKKELGDDSLDGESLGGLIADLLQFMDDVAGVNVSDQSACLTIQQSRSLLSTTGHQQGPTQDPHLHVPRFQARGSDLRNGRQNPSNQEDARHHDRVWKRAAQERGVGKRHAGSMPLFASNPFDGIIPARAQNLEVYMNVRRELEKNGFITSPKVFIDASCSQQDQTRLKDAVKRLGGLVANAAGELDVACVLATAPQAPLVLCR